MTHDPSTLTSRQHPVPQADVTHVGNLLSALHEAALPEGSDNVASTWQAEQCLAAVLSLAEKAYDQGYNALLNLKAYSGIPSSKATTVFEFLATGIPAFIIVPGTAPSVTPAKAKLPEVTLSPMQKQQKQRPEASHAREHKRNRDSYLNDVGPIGLH